jgi:N-acetylglucosaminyldiphosphoundecaprenol N-acetyl-beta-D-mannosaminyltransferase
MQTAQSGRLGREMGASIAPPRVNILGVHISAIDMQQALETIGGWVERRESRYVCVTPAHVVMDCHWNPELRPLFNRSGLTTPDGMSIVWLLQLKGFRGVGRVYGADLMLETCRLSLDRGWRHFFYGGGEGVAEDLAAGLQKHFPGLQVAGTYTPPFRPLTEAEERDAVKRIDDSRADIVWVGISSPKQEQWMARHVGKIFTPVLIGVGAAFDFLSGRKRQAPRWIQRAGMEWLFRLATEPRRLWRRYSQYPLFGLLALAQWAGLSKYE